MSAVLPEQPAATPHQNTSLDAARRELADVVTHAPWGLALILVGWVHLVVFLACHLLHASGDRTKHYYLALWLIELIAVLVIMRRMLGRGWSRATLLVQLAFRIWITFLILSFNLASLNTLTGYKLEWFKPAWATLSSFVFMTLAWLCSIWFLAPAVFMYFAGLLMLALPKWPYAIYAVSWWLILQVLGIQLARKRQARLG